MELQMSKKVFEVENKAIFFILFIALILRSLWALIVPVEPVSDSIMYHEFAKVMSDSGRYAFPAGNLTAYWPVGIPAIYGGLYKVFGQHYEVIVVANVIIGLLTTHLIYLITLNWFNQKTALIAAFIYATWPSQIQFTSVLASELIFNLFVLAGIYFWIKRAEKKLKMLIISSIFFAAAAYVRPIALLIPFILIGISFLSQVDLKKAMIQSIITSAVMAVLIAPWAYRNYQLFGEVVLISTNGGPVFWMGNNPDSKGEYMPLPEIEFDSEVQRAKYLKQEAIEHIKAEPIIFVKRMAKRLIDYYRSENIGIVWNMGGLKQINADASLLTLKLVSSGYWMLILLLAIYGLWQLFKAEGFWQTITETPIFALLCYFTVLHVIIASGDRYHFPIIPFLAMLAAYTLHRVKKPEK
jgi:4-amino-4-deoxy-L-arabinose transferase-like glycosyltransferase